MKKSRMELLKLALFELKVATRYAVKGELELRDMRLAQYYEYINQMKELKKGA